jgi:hypothetical protein
MRVFTTVGVNTMLLLPLIIGQSAWSTSFSKKENFMSNLYLIKSEERDGLVKIGFTSGDVGSRIENYKTGISDSSVIHEMAGSKTFEAFFHSFFSSYRKPVPIWFKLSNAHLPGPREWFVLEPRVLAVILDALEKRHPKKVEDVDVSELPIFLSGLITAIQWDAEMSSPERLADIARRIELIESSAALEQEGLGNDRLTQAETVSFFNDYPRSADDERQQPTESPLPSYHNAEASSIASRSEIKHAIAQYMNESPEKVEALTREMAIMKDLQTSRTIIAFVAILCVAYLSLISASVALFSFIAFGLLIIWPYIYHWMANMTVDFWHWLQQSAARARQGALDKNG